MISTDPTQISYTARSLSAKGVHTQITWLISLTTKSGIVVPIDDLAGIQKRHTINAAVESNYHFFTPKAPIENVSLEQKETLK